MISVDDELPSTRRVPPLLCVPPDPSPDAANPGDTPGLPGFSVELFYVEPGYAASMNAEPRTYSFLYTVHAASPEAAIEVARARFHETWRASGVGWERRITQVHVVQCKG